MKLINMIGRRFGMLKVIKREYPNSIHHSARWLCKCDCGTEKIIDGADLRISHTKSCDCLRRFKPSFGNMRALIGVYKKGAKIRGLEYNLTEEQFKKLTKQDCHYCGEKPSQIFNNKDCNGEYIYNGIDRVDSNLGYIISNCVPCCKFCNMAKNNRTLQEFKEWIKRIYNKTFES